MNKHFTYFLSMAISLFFLGACQPDPIPIRIKAHDPKLVLTTQVLPGQVLIAALTRSFSALDNNPDNTNTDSVNILSKFAVSNAKITIDHNGIAYEMSSIDSLPGFFYSFEMSIEENQTYSLTAKDMDSGEEVSSVVTTLPQVNLSNIVSTRKGENIEVDFEFIDPSGKNYYMLNFYPVTINENTINNVLNIFASDDATTAILEDSNFENNTYQDTITLRNWDSDTLVVGLSNISSDYYEFLSLRRKSGQLFNILFEEPLIYPSNVKNGLGFFNLHSTNYKWEIVP